MKLDINVRQFVNALTFKVLGFHKQEWDQSSDCNWNGNEKSW